MKPWQWIVTSLVLLVTGIGIGQVIAQRLAPPRLPEKPNAFERLRAGYYEIPDTPDCHGQLQGTIRIRLSNLLGNLQGPEKTLHREISFFPPSAVSRLERRDAGGEIGEPQPDVLPGFPTRLDFYTLVGPRGKQQRLVDPSSYVMVRVVLDQSAAGANESVEFLHQTPTPAQVANDPIAAAKLAAGSQFAIMRAAGTDKKMFCSRRDIVKGSDQSYVEFGVQSTSVTGQPVPYTGYFGIGLVVRDSDGRHLTPIILDPGVRNEG
jgi:hypothetical protein